MQFKPAQTETPPLSLRGGSCDEAISTSNPGVKLRLMDTCLPKYRFAVVERAIRQDGGFLLVGDDDEIRKLIPGTCSLSDAQSYLQSHGWNAVGPVTLPRGGRALVFSHKQFDFSVAVYELVKWALVTDIEGFGNIFSRNDNEAIKHLHNLMAFLICIGRGVYPDEANRLFIHQIGDCFVIVPGCGDTDLRRALAIGTALHRFALAHGFCLKSAISLGKIADYQGCYPSQIRDGFARIGTGLMTVFPVIGDGIINAYKLSQKFHGASIGVDIRLDDLIPGTLPTRKCGSHTLLDWVHGSLPECDYICAQLRHLPVLNGGAIEQELRAYVSACKASDDWCQETNQLIQGY